MDMTMDMPTGSPPTRPSTSFLDLPREIRDSIYHLALHRPTRLRPVGKISYFCQLHGPLRQKETCVSIDSPPFHPATPLAISVSKLLNPGIPLQLLRVNKQIHEEAVETLYGGNRFSFIIGPTARVPQVCHRFPRERERVCGDESCRVHHDCYRHSHDGRHFTYEDNLFDLPSHYLKLIKRCVIHVKMPAVPLNRESQLYVSVQTSLKEFAARFGGLEHSLQDVAIYLNQPQTDDVPPEAEAQLQALSTREKEALWRGGLSVVDGCLTRRDVFACAPRRRAENVLEPLGTVFGMRTVKVVGGSSELAAKLSRAMTSSGLTCVPKEESYGTRRARVARRRHQKETQRYKLGRFYETKFDWENQVSM